MDAPTLITSLNGVGPLHPGQYFSLLKPLIGRMASERILILVDFPPGEVKGRVIEELHRLGFHGKAVVIANGEDWLSSFRLFFQIVARLSLEEVATAVRGMSAVTNRAGKFKDCHWSRPLLLVARLIASGAKKMAFGHADRQTIEKCQVILQLLIKKGIVEPFSPQLECFENLTIFGVDNKRMSHLKKNGFPLLPRTDEDLYPYTALLKNDPDRINDHSPGEPNRCNVADLHSFFVPEFRQKLETVCRGGMISCGDCRGRLAQGWGEFSASILGKPFKNSAGAIFTAGKRYLESLPEVHARG